MSTTPSKHLETNHRHSCPGGIVSVRNIHRVFSTDRGEIEALKDVSLDIGAGEFSMLLGPSGCGKSTLLRIIAGLDTPTSGTTTSLKLNGKPATNAMVFHGRTLFPWLSMRGNVSYGLKLQGMSRRALLDRTDELLHAVGLLKFADSWPHQVSEGMRQRASIARALAVDPDVLLMDEPFGSLDEQTRILLHEEVLNLREQTGKTFLFVTHNIDEAMLLGDSIHVMSARPGSICATFKVPFGRPRSLESVRMDPRAASMYTEIYGVLREQVNAGGDFR